MMKRLGHAVWVAFNRYLDRMEGREVSKRLEQSRNALLKQGVKDHQIAKSWGYDLCDCTNPPTIMLFKTALKVNQCGACGFEKPVKRSQINEALNPAGRSSDSPQTGQTSAF